MNLLRLIFQRYRAAIGLVLVLSVASAGLSVMVIAFINERLLQVSPAMGTALGYFAGLLLALFAVSTGSQLAMTTLGHWLVYELRCTLVKRILDTSVERLETLGLARLLASLNSDTSHITTAFMSLPSVVYGLTLSLGGFGYLAWLSLPLFLMTLAWVSLTIVVGWGLLKRTHEQVRLARAAEDRLYADYQAVIEGRKELTLNRARAYRVYTEEFDQDARHNRHHEIRADLYNVLNDNWVNTMVLGALGLTFFLAHRYGWADLSTAATYALTILFLRAPLTNMVSATPSLVSGSVALAKVQSLELADYQPEFKAVKAHFLADWHALHLESVTYRYQGENGADGFVLGPVDLTLHRGEVVFLIGGNGSGKSTLARLLTGLYHPHSGRIRVDDTVIDATNRPAFHGLFATVFSDFYLFTQLLGPEGSAATEPAVRSWLATFAMTHKVTVDNHRLVDTRLSHGQRKRLALLLALLEQRPVLVLDEWAADQDPLFRRVFYTEILLALKAAGSTVLAITHDDHYFALADRLFKMDGGRLLELRGELRERATADAVREIA